MPDDPVSTFPRRPNGPGPTRRSLWVLVGLVVVLVAGMILVPYWFDARLAALLDRRERVLEPADEAVDVVQVALAREAAATRGFLLTGDPAFRDVALRAAAERQRALTALDVLSGLLVPAVRDSIEALQRALARWNSANEPMLRGAMAPREVGPRLQVSEAEYEAALTAALGASAAIGAETEAALEEIRRADRQWIGAQALLIVLVLIITGMVFWWAHQIRFHGGSRAFDGAFARRRPRH